MNLKIQNATKVFARLPKQRVDDFLPAIQAARKQKIDAIIVLDDDPTGTQTVYDVPILTNWTREIIEQEFQKATPLFYILTNSRSLTAGDAENLAIAIGQNIQMAAQKTDTSYWVISRSDSTLRGHYPCEVAALEEGLGEQNSIHFIIPAFFEGGRYTIDNVHYVHKGKELIPAAQTPYAKDKVFGYQYSDLTHWVAEKTEGAVTADKVATISIKELRTLPLTKLVAKLNQLEKGTVCIVNAADYSDLYFLAFALLKSTVQPLLRTAASFVAAIGGLAEKPLLSGASIKDKNTKNGGLIIVGSYVPTSSSQLKHLLNHRPNIVAFEIEVEQVLNTQKVSKLWLEYTRKIDDAIKNSHTVILYTSRTLVSATTEKENLTIGQTVSNFLTEIISHLTIQPAYLLTKGGITSSDIATKSLGIQRAMVKGQIIKGVPVWELGKETKFPNSHQIIFPGNVGTESSLTKVVDKLTKVE